MSAARPELVLSLQCAKVGYLERSEPSDWRVREGCRFVGGGDKHMIDQPTPEQPKAQGRKKVAVACQGGGIHTSFAVGVLTEILKDIQQNDRFDLMGLSGTSGGALCTLMAWYGLAQKNGRPGSEEEAINQLNEFWDRFAATRPAEKLLSQFSYAAFRAQEMEVLGLSASVLGLNPRSTISKAITARLPFLGVRRRYFDLHRLLDKSCPLFDRNEKCACTRC
jgi:predicted acylesterase/phospholipase RssA